MQTVPFSEALSAAIMGSSWHPAEDGRRGLPLSTDRGPFEVTFTDDTALSCIFSLPESDGHVAVLNFASAVNPGGGFRGGAEAQEESLTRSSGLFPCLEKFKDSHYALPLNGGLYTHSMIFSPVVPFFRNDDGSLRAPRLASVITSPACNSRRIKNPKVAADVRTVMKERTRRVFHLAAAEHVDVLVLGAWGCGVFGGCPQEMAETFKQVAGDHKFQHIRCAFAIPDPTVRAVFTSVFAGQTPERRRHPPPAQPEKRWKGKPRRERRMRDGGFDGDFLYSRVRHRCGLYWQFPRRVAFLRALSVLVLCFFGYFRCL